MLTAELADTAILVRRPSAAHGRGDYETTANARPPEATTGYHDLVDNGRREIYMLEK